MSNEILGFTLEVKVYDKNKKRIKNDFYPTPKNVIHNFLDYYDLKRGNILEPSAGNGNIIEVLRERGIKDHITAIELREEEKPSLKKCADEVFVEDFLEHKSNTKYKTIIGNPPFSLALEFMNKCFEIADEDTEIVMLLRTAFLESKRRKKFWDKHPLSELYVLSKRPSFLNNGKTDSTSYSWFIWKGAKNQKINII